MILSVSWEFLARSLILICAAAFGYLWYADDYHPFFDATNYLLNLGLLGVLYIASGRLSRIFPLFRVVSLVIFFYVSMRMAVIGYFPKWLFLGGRTQQSGMENTLWLFFLGSIACYVAIALGSWSAGLPRRGRQLPVIDPGAFYLISGACIFSCLLLLFNELAFGFAGSSGSGEHLNFFRRYFSRLFEPIALYTLVLVAYSLLVERTDKAKWMLRITVFLFVLILTVTGSRAGIYEAVVVYIGMRPVTRNDFNIQISAKKLLFIPLLAILLPLFFYIATSLRAYRYQFDPARFYTTEGLSVIEQISRRLSLVESTLFPVAAKEMTLYDISDLVNLQTTVENTINRLVPGKPYGYRIYSEFGWCFLIHKNGCYAYQSLDRSDLVGYEWGMWGISYQLFGFAGAIVFIFVFTYLCTVLAQSMLMRNTFLGLSFYAFGAYALQFWVKNLGLDNWFDRFGHTFFLLTLYCFFLSWVTDNRRRVRQQRARARAQANELLEA